MVAEFVLMQSLDLIYTKNFSVRKNLADKRATRGLLTARCGRSGLVYKPETIERFFFLFWKISLGIVQVGIKTWKWSPSENDESPKFSPGLSREKGLEVLL